jgi:ABC-type thiamine transport system substrate-binding protein
LDAQVQAKIYAVLEAKLRKKCGTSVLDKATLIRILTELEAEAKVLIKAELPKIGADLKLKIKEEVQACVKDVEVHIPLVTKIKIDADFNAKVTLDACVAVGLKMCAKLNAKALAKLVLAKL